VQWQQSALTAAACNVNAEATDEPPEWIRKKVENLKQSQLMSENAASNFADRFLLLYSSCRQPQMNYVAVH